MIIRRCAGQADRRTTGPVGLTARPGPDRDLLPTAALEWRDDEEIRPCQLYEFYWADESRIGDSVWNKARAMANPSWDCRGWPARGSTARHKAHRAF